MKRFLLSAAIVLFGTATSQAETLKFKLDGIKCDQCAGDILNSLKGVTAATVKTEPTKAAPMATIDLDLAKTDVGAIGKAVAITETPHRSEEAPGAYLLIDAPALTKANAKKLEAALKKVKGVNADLSSADVKKMQIAVLLDGSGAGKLAEIQKALMEFTKK